MHISTFPIKSDIKTIYGFISLRMPSIRQMRKVFRVKIRLSDYCRNLGDSI